MVVPVTLESLLRMVLVGVHKREAEGEVEFEKVRFFRNGVYEARVRRLVEGRWLTREDETTSVFPDESEGGPSWGQILRSLREAAVGATPEHGDRSQVNGWWWGRDELGHKIRWLVEGGEVTSVMERLI